MTAEFSLVTAFLAGLLGGVHCVGMCGGIVGALSFGLPGAGREKVVPLLLAYNSGRVFSYAVAGAIMGGLGLAASQLMDVRQAQLVLQVVAGLFMIAMGLYLGGWWFGLLRLEKAGGMLWRRLEPVARRLLPVRNVAQALALGMVWGWLPCGLVYSVLVWSIASGGAVEGALLMLSFGVGTLPNLLAMGLAAHTVAGAFKRPWVRSLAGAVVVAFGVAAIATPFL